MILGGGIFGEVALSAEEKVSLDLCSYRGVEVCNVRISL